MKKNKMMRFASILLVLVFLTIGIVSGTFAKYTSAQTINETATVAKWGVKMTASGSLFGKTYLSAVGKNELTTSTSAAITVKSTGNGNVIAPGTQNSTGLKFTLDGTAETGVKVMMAVSGSSVYLKANSNLPDMTSAVSTASFNLTSDYDPIKFTLKQGDTVLTSGAISVIQSYFNSDDNAVTFDAGTDFSSLSNKKNIFTLTWEWDIGDSANNQADTLLGRLAAGETIKTLTKGKDYNLTANLEIKFIAEQVD